MNYLETLQDLETRLQDLIINTLHRGYLTPNQKNYVMARVASAVRKADRQLKVLAKGNSDLDLIRLKVLNQIHIETFNLLFTSRPRDLITAAKRIDDIFCIKYSNGSKHHMLNYVDSVLSVQAINELKASVNPSTPYGMISTEQTWCYLCTPWLGVVGSVGQNVEGLVRLDSVWPFHIRCIHRIKLLGELPTDIKQPEEWMLTANRREYYRRFVQDPINRLHYREQQRGYYSKQHRIQSIAGKLKYL